MSFVQCFKMAWKSIGSSKSRTALTMLGIIIGVCAVIILVGVVQGTTNMVMDNFREMGTNLVQVSVTNPSATRKLTVEDMEDFMADNTDYCELYTPIVTGRGTVKYQTTNQPISVYGINEDYIAIQNMEFTEGRGMSGLDVERNMRVAMVEEGMVEDLFEGADPIGKDIRINGEVFQVIGVVKSSAAASLMGGGDMVYIPYTTAMKVFKIDNITSYAIQTFDDMQDIVTRNLQLAMYQKFRDEDAYMVISSEEMLDMVNTMMGTMTNVLAGVAAISLLVGGIGIMNIMLVSVTERTREIGIRKAIGAKRRSILSQFLIESVVVSCMGGIIGIILGIVLANVLANAMGLTASVSTGIILFSFFFSMGVGIFFGLYPANKASKLNPIEALRHE